MASSTTAKGSQHDENVLVDTGVMRIEELRGPDALADSSKKIRTYLKDSDDIAQRSLQPVTGDQGALSY